MSVNTKASYGQAYHRQQPHPEQAISLNLVPASFRRPRVLETLLVQHRDRLSARSLHRLRRVWLLQLLFQVGLSWSIRPVQVDKVVALEDKQVRWNCSMFLRSQFNRRKVFPQAANTDHFVPSTMKLLCLASQITL